MSFRDFLIYFGELEICHLTPDSVNNEDNRKKFEVFHFYGEWSFGSTAGGCGNDGNRKDENILYNSSFICHITSMYLCHITNLYWFSRQTCIFISSNLNELASN